MSRILVPVNLSGVPHEVLDAVKSNAAGGGKEVALLHVIETLRDASEGDLDDAETSDIATFYQEIEERSRDQLAAIRAELSTEGLKATANVRYGSRVDQILEFVVENETELIVMQSHAVTVGSQPGAFASISYQVAALSPCSIHLVKVGGPSERS